MRSIKVAVGVLAVLFLAACVGPTIGEPSATPQPLRVGIPARVCVDIAFTPPPALPGTWDLQVSDPESSYDAHGEQGSPACLSFTPARAGEATVFVRAGQTGADSRKEAKIPILEAGADATTIAGVSFSPNPVRQESPVTVCADIVWGPGEPGTGSWMIVIQPGSSIGWGRGTDNERACVTSSQPVPAWDSVTAYVGAARGGSVAERRVTAPVSAASTAGGGDAGPTLGEIIVSSLGG